MQGAGVKGHVMNDARGKTPDQFGCLVALVGFSAVFAFASFPHPFWRLGAHFAIIAFASIFLRVGWFVQLSMTGAYLGIWLQPIFLNGTYVARMEATLARIFIGAFVGFVVGFSIDAHRNQIAMSQTEAPGDSSNGTMSDSTQSDVDAICKKSHSEIR